MAWKAVRRCVGGFFEYDTPKIVHIRSLKVGILYRLVQLIIIGYIVGVVMIYKKGYQETENVESTVTSKVKGIVMTNHTDPQTNVTVPRIWDTPDYVVPPQDFVFRWKRLGLWDDHRFFAGQFRYKILDCVANPVIKIESGNLTHRIPVRVSPENGAFFITTNYVITPNQEQGICPEVSRPDKADITKKCINDADCPAAGPERKSENGVNTGTCNTTTGTCNIYAWCPVEEAHEPRELRPRIGIKTDFGVTLSVPLEPSVVTDVVLAWNIVYFFASYRLVRRGLVGCCFPTSIWLNSSAEEDIPQLAGTEDFTVMIKNQIIFPKFNVRRRNIRESDYTNKSYLSSCRFDALHDPYCPIYRLGDIVAMAGENYTELAVDGAVLGIVIIWNCDLDYSVEKCLPQFTFRRIDRKDDALSKGWNFRYANYWTDTVNGTSIERRTLVKAFGIRFIFYVYGTAGRFNIVPFATNLGAGLALLGLSVVICDIILLYCTKRRGFYADQKYLMVKDEDAFLIDESQRSAYDYASYQSDT